ncbi:MAG: VanZ family protein [Rubrivivax sp.]|nr:VanZ family protein [Rubrivivax sp.]
MPRLDALLHEIRFRPRWRALLALLAITATCFAFRPGPGVAPGFTGADKIEHLLAFGAMACTGALGFSTLWPVAASLLGYGVFIEVVQLWIPGREASVADVLADAAGIALGFALVSALRHRWPPR